jgi:hypothetical protein
LPGALANPGNQSPPPVAGFFILGKPPFAVNFNPWHVMNCF